MYRTLFILCCSSLFCWFSSSILYYLFFLFYSSVLLLFFFFFFNDTATTEIYTFPYTTLFRSIVVDVADVPPSNIFNSAAVEVTFVPPISRVVTDRSEEHTSELQSPCNLVCRLLLEKKKKIHKNTSFTKLSKMTSSQV